MSCYVNLICNFLHNAQKINSEQKEQLQLVLREILVNAIEHGNCGISFEDKSEWLESGKPIGELIAQRCQDAEVAARKVSFEYSILPTYTRFVVQDQGNGFDWRAEQEDKDEDPEEAILRLHGRGIALTKEFTRNLEYSEKGNVVSFEFIHKQESSEITPAIFARIPPQDIQPGEVVIEQGENSNNLYYIAKGEYEVIVNGNIVSTLSSEDIFLGEMSFLTRNKRSATIRAKTAGKLIRITKKQFIQAIKKQPHYGLFLCRLLAQRIERLNELIEK